MAPKKAGEIKRRRVFPVVQKLEAIKMFEKEHDYDLVANKFAVSKYYVKEWVDSKDQLKTRHKKELLKAQLRRKDDLDEKFQKDVVKWIQQQRKRGVEILYKDLQDKGEQMRIARGLNKECTIRWVRNLVKKHQLTLRSYTKVKRRRAFTVKQKLAAVKMFEKEQDYGLVANKFAIAKKELKSWVNGKQKLKAWYKKKPLATQLNCSNDLDENFRKDVVKWIQQERERRVEISYKNLLVKAEQMRIARGLNSECTIGWARHLVKKHKLKLR